MNNDQNILLALRNVSKEYFGVKVLKNINLKIDYGTIHGLVGENGAGKSTTIKIIAGAISPTSGVIEFDGARMNLSNPKEAIDKGIGVVYQEFNLFPNLNVYENIFFGIELKNERGFLERKKMAIETKRLLKELGFDFDVYQKVGDLSTAYRQIVEIAKCINHNIKLLIMDEPSTSLTENEVKEMFKVVRRLNDKGVTIIYISHKLDEVLELTDNITVLRDGSLIKTVKTKGTTENDLIKMMVGREISDIYPQKKPCSQKVILEVQKIANEKVHDVSFELHEGEVLGFGGLVGAGRTELMRLIFGADKKRYGQIYLEGKNIVINTPENAIREGIGLVPEDRKHDGLILNKSIYLNCLIPSIETYKRNMDMIDFRQSELDIKKIFKRLNIKATGLDQKVRNLSGGNQQKVVIEKWLLKNCKVLILDEPTRGVDVGAKEEIYQLINKLASEGKAIIVVSSEMPELIGLSHRVLVMADGYVTGELKGDAISQEEIMKLASREV